MALDQTCAQAAPGGPARRFIGNIYLWFINTGDSRRRQAPAAFQSLQRVLVSVSWLGERRPDICFLTSASVADTWLLLHDQSPASRRPRVHLVPFAPLQSRGVTGPFLGSIQESRTTGRTVASAGRIDAINHCQARDFQRWLRRNELRSWNKWQAPWNCRLWRPVTPDMYRVREPLHTAYD